jgi:hypothetical protein
VSSSSTCCLAGTLRPVLLALLLGLAFACGTAAGRTDLERSPYGPVAIDLLGRLHAAERACELTLDPATRCFTIAPGSVAAAAEALEQLMAEYGGTLLRSAWRSANGVHHVELRLSDDLWGALEVWLTEPDAQNVAGRLLYVPKRRNGLR